MAPTAGWYDDPRDGGKLRYWDGAAWTAQSQSYFLPIRDALGQTLVLHGGGLVPKAEDLKLGDQVVVRLGWGGLMDRFSGDLTLESDSGSWRIDQQGLLPPRHVIFGATGQVAAMEWQLTKGTGTLTFTDGRRFVWDDEWTKVDRWATPVRHAGQWWLWDTSGRAVIGAAHDGTTTTVQANPAAAEIPELALLAGLGTYLVLRWLDTQVHRDRRHDRI